MAKTVNGPVPQGGVAAVPAAFGEFAMQGHKRDAPPGLGDAPAEVDVVDIEAGLWRHRRAGADDGRRQARCAATHFSTA